MELEPKQHQGIGLQSMGILYFALFFVAILIDQNQNLFQYPEVDENFQQTLIADIGIALALAVAMLLISMLLDKTVPAYRELSRLFSKLFGKLGISDCFMVSIFSALGEEFFFRGMIQAWLGLIPTSIAFGLLHTGPSKKFIPWTLFAISMGFALGLVYEWRGNLLLPVIAHFAFNFVSLAMMNRKHWVKSQ